MKHLAAITTLTLLLALSACTTTTVDEYRENATALALESGERVVVLGRRHYADYETEPDFIDCIGDKLKADKEISVLPEKEFVDLLYPWFEPRTAPLGLKRLSKMLNEPMIAQRFKEQGLHYMIWIDGSTETTDRGGSVSCAVGPGGGGCFGFATWEKTGTYEAIIWDLQTLKESGRVKVEARGSSYMVAIILPIPIVAQVQDQACDGIGLQLRTFFIGNRAGEAS
ncbi:MAG: hypothetical protein DRQ64_00570 [Gammaproteobacteria bacterium]|nr:MAG: hypothetical protein DRQ64_00570 [Gammaproteobacteria bacterium]